MLVELGLAGVGLYTCSWLNDSWKRTIKREFNKVMEGIGIYNKQDKTFYIIDAEKKDYGLKCIVGIPQGLSLEHLLSKQNIIEDNFGCILEISKGKFSSSAVMYVIWEDIAKYKFKPVRCEPHQLYLGKDIKGKDYFLDLNRDCHLLIGGTTGTGKSFLLASILTNTIYFNSKNIEIYLSQIVKGEIGAFSKCPGVKFTAYNIEAVEVSLRKVCGILDKRSELFTVNGIKNITQWNKHYPGRKMKRIIYILEELSFFMDHKEVWSYILEIAKAGRSCGIHLLGLLQKSTATNLPTDLKSQMTRLTFKQKSGQDSSNIVGIPDAKDLKNQECIVDSNEGVSKLHTPWIDEDFNILHKYVPTIAIPSKECKINIVRKPKKIKKAEKQGEKPNTTVKPTPTTMPSPTLEKNNNNGVISLKELIKNDK